MLIVRWQWGTPPLLLLDQDEFHSETTIYLSIHKTHNKNGWFLGHDDPPRLAPADDDEDAAVWWCLQCHSRKCPHFFSRGWWCRHNDWWRVRAEPWKGPSSPPRRRGQQRRTSLFPYTLNRNFLLLSRCWPHFRVYHHHHLPPPQYHHTILNFFIILFRCDMTKIGWMRRLIDCLLTWEEHNF